MTTTLKFLAAALLIAAGSAVFPPRASAQVTTAPAIVLKQPKPKYDIYRGDVVNYTSTAITVRDPNNVYNIRTFQFSPGLRSKMENRTIEHGFRITVKVQHASDVAVALRGKKLKVSQ
jgi:hypothetical protein